MAEPADINVDELRRRARRRLIGAIVLALGAAVIVPMLLESDPKPLGEDISVKIPPVDNDRFVNRLNDAKSKADTASSEPKAKRSVTEAERAVIAPAAKAPRYDTAAAPDKPATAATEKETAAASPPAAAPAPAPSAPEVASQASSAPPASAPSGAQESTAAPTAAPKIEARSAAPAPEAPRDGFAVQLAAFSDDKGANSLVNRLKRTGYPAYTEPLQTSRGTLWRVRVGPYPSRDAAIGVRDKLKTEGQNGIVAPARN